MLFPFCYFGNPAIDCPLNRVPRFLFPFPHSCGNEKRPLKVAFFVSAAVFMT